MYHIDKILLKKLRKKLPKKYKEALARETEYSESYIVSVLTGKRKNEKIMKAAISLAQNTKSEADSFTSSIHDL